jgi:polyisoprenyl-teichoic acid--peptidoglycan teichoic acid transferase
MGLVILAPMPALPEMSTAALADPRVRFRRAVTLLVMTVFAPGSAQLVAGNRRIGRIAVRAFAVGALGALTLAALGVLWRAELVRVLTTLEFLTLLRGGLVVYAVAWAYLIVDTWRIADPAGLGQRQRLELTALNCMVCLALSGSLLFASHVVAVQRDFIATVFAATEVSGAADGRYNVLLLGGDAGPLRSGIRPDSITVASIDADTGRAVLIGLPRNLANAPFPDGSRMDQRFPNGFDCDGCYLNAVNTWATDHANLFPDSEEPGIEATTQAVEQITGLSISYYVLIDLKGFQDLVDAVGGVTLKVTERIPIGGVGGAITGWIEPGTQHLDGYRTLWFARSRATSDDYSRMARQKCVMSAMLQQLDPQTVVTNFGDIAAAGKQVISTSIPNTELGTFVNLAMKTRRLPVATVSFVPPKINTSDPDWDLTRTMVSAAIDKSEGKDDASPVRSNRPTKPRNANTSADLASSC